MHTWGKRTYLILPKQRLEEMLSLGELSENYNSQPKKMRALQRTQTAGVLGQN